ncbi:MAG: YceD family protein [Aeromicrobium erythreum]
MSSPELVFDTRSLGRQPGTEKTVDRVVEAPADLGHDVYGVPEGSPIAIELRLEAVMDGVLATGTASARVTGECVRCLRDLDDDLVVDLQELYVYDPSDDDEEELALDEDLLDLEPVLRDAVVLALPLNPVCDPECPGLCPQCGTRLADDPDHTHGEAIDPRWAALSTLTDDPSDAGQPASDQSKE